MKHSATVLGVPAADAIAWAAGRLSDADLLLSGNFPAEAVFIVDLPDWRSYKDCLAKCAWLRQRGAVCLITRTGNPVVAAHIKRFGGIEFLKETYDLGNGPLPEKKFRLLVPPDGFFKWTEKFSKTPPPRPVSPTPGNAQRSFAPCVPLPGPSSPRSEMPPGDNSQKNGA